MCGPMTASAPPVREWGGYLTFYDQTRPYRALDGKTPEPVYSAT